MRNLALLFWCLAVAYVGAQAPPQVPSGPLHYGFFLAQFAADGTFTLSGEGWPSLKGTWKRDGSVIEIVTPDAPGGCDKPGRYTATVAGSRVLLEMTSDTCTSRRMILDHSAWLPAGESELIPERKIVRTAAPSLSALRKAAPDPGSWPSFRGPSASGVAEGMHLPDRWDGATGENILWRTPIPGLGHSSPIVRGDRVFVTTAVSSKASASFKPGLYGDGDASEDRSSQQWMILAIDKKTG